MKRKKREEEIKDGKDVNRSLREIMRQFMPRSPEIIFTMVKDDKGAYVGVKADLNFQICKNTQKWTRDKEKIKNRFAYSDLHTLGRNESFEIEKISNFEIRMDKSFLWNFAKNVMMLSRYVNAIKFEPASITVYIGPIDHEFRAMTLSRCWGYFMEEIKSNIKEMLELGFTQEVKVLYRADDFPQEQEQAWKLVEIAQKDKKSARKKVCNI